MERLLLVCRIVICLAVFPDVQTLESGADYVEVSVGSTPKVLHLGPQQAVRLLAEHPISGDHFQIVEAHSREWSVMLSNEAADTVANSTSPAILLPPSLQPSSAILTNFNDANITVLASMRSYLGSGPMPIDGQAGLSLHSTSDILQATFSLATLPSSDSELQYDLYQYFLPASDCTEELFELAYNQITCPEDLVALGRHVATLGHNRTTVHLAAYPAVGRILGLVVTPRYANSSSVPLMYGLAHSYSCRLVADGPRGCQDLHTTETWLVCACGIFLGIFLALAGHRFFKCSQLIFGFYLGSVVAYVVIRATHLSLDEILVLGLSGLCGLFSAVFVLGLWWFFGIPVLAVLLPLLEMGVLVSCAFFAQSWKPGDLFASDTKYWLTFTCVALLPTLLLIACSQKASIISCAVVGMTTVIYCIDHFTRSSLKYVIIDAIRRAVVPDFGSILLDGPPFQQTDLFLLTCLLVGILLGLVCQLVLERNKPPFPPSPYQLYRWRRIPSSEEEEEHGRHDRSRVSNRRPEEASPVPSAAAPVVGYILRVSGSGSSLLGLGAPRPPAAGSIHQGSSGRARDIFDPAVYQALQQQSS